MTTITDAYINALLADATYAISSDIKDDEDALLADLTERLGANLAQFITNNFIFNNPT